MCCVILCVYRFFNCLCKTLFYGKFYKKTSMLQRANIVKKRAETMAP